MFLSKLLSKIASISNINTPEKTGKSINKNPKVYLFEHINSDWENLLKIYNINNEQLLFILCEFLLRLFNSL